MANMWTRDAKNAMVPVMIIVWLLLFFASWVERSCLFWGGGVSVYGPVLGAGFDQERTLMFDALSFQWVSSSSIGFLVVTNAEVGFRGSAKRVPWKICSRSS